MFIFRNLGRVDPTLGRRSRCMLTRPPLVPLADNDDIGLTLISDAALREELLAAKEDTAAVVGEATVRGGGAASLRATATTSTHVSSFFSRRRR